MSEEVAPWLPLPEGTPDSVRPIAGMSHPRFHDDGVEETLSALRDRGIVTMVSLERFTGTWNSTVWTDQDCYHVNLDVPDFEPPSRDHINRFFAAVEERRDGGIVVHCTAGVGRTGTMMALYLVRYVKMTPDEAIQWVRMHRNPRCLETPEQEQCVRDFGDQS